MARVYDAIVIGAGHNGLVTAACLARAGRSVVVLEQADVAGGLVGTDEFAPGFRGPVCFPSIDLFHPGLTHELALGDHGLEILTGDGGTWLPCADGEDLHAVANGDGYRLSGVSAEAHAALDALDGFLGRVAAAIEPAMTDPLPELEPRGIGEVFDLLKLGWRLRRLGDADAGEAMRFLPMNVRDVLDERFQDEGLKALLAARALTASWLGPRSPGSAYGLLHHRPAWTSHLFQAPRYPRGGPGGLAQALAGAATAAGVDLRVSAEVREVRVNAEGVHGVVLANGEEIAARVVASGIEPRRTLLELADPTWLDPEFVTALRRVRGRGAIALVRFALDALPAFPGLNGQTPSRIQIGASMDDLERAFDATKYGTLPEAPSVDCHLPSTVDASLAPAGKHVLVAWVEYAAHTLTTGTWSDAGATLADRVTAAIGRHVPGFADRVLHRDVVTPADLERRYGLPGGCVYHVDLTLDQLLYMRPVPGWYGYRTPIRGLYLCGAGTHGGGGVTGLPGRNAAKRIVGDS